MAPREEAGRHRPADAITSYVITISGHARIPARASRHAGGRCRRGSGRTGIRREPQAHAQRLQHVGRRRFRQRAGRKQLPQCRVCIGIAERREFDTRDGAVRADPRAHDDRGRRRSRSARAPRDSSAPDRAHHGTQRHRDDRQRDQQLDQRESPLRRPRRARSAARMAVVVGSVVARDLHSCRWVVVRRVDRGTQPHRRRDGRRARTLSAAYGTHVSNGTDHLARAARTDRRPGAPHPLSRDGHGTTRPGGRANGWKTGSDRKKHPAAGGER